MFLTKNFPEASKKVLSQQKTQYRKIYEQLPFYWLCSISTPLKNCKKIPKMFTSSFPWKILNTTSKILFGYGLGFTKKINLSKCFTFLTTFKVGLFLNFRENIFFFAKVFFREIITLYQYRSKLSWRSTYLSDYKHGENENYTNTAWIFTHQFCITKTNNRKKNFVKSAFQVTCEEN